MEIYPEKAAFLYLLVINVLTFCVWGADKRRAKRKQWRVSEKRLWLLAVLGGGIGAVLGMQMFHHKTKKLLFQIGIPVLALVQTALAVYFCYMRM